MIKYILYNVLNIFIYFNNKLNIIFPKYISYIGYYKKCNIILSYDIRLNDQYIYCNNYYKQNNLNLCNYHRKLKRYECNNYHLIENENLNEIDLQLLAEYELYLRNLYTKKYCENIINENHLIFECQLLNIIKGIKCSYCKNIIFPFKEIKNYKIETKCLHCNTVYLKSKMDIFIDYINDLKFKDAKISEYLNIEYNNKIYKISQIFDPLYINEKDMYKNKKNKTIYNLNINILNELNNNEYYIFYYNIKSIYC